MRSFYLALTNEGSPLRGGERHATQLATVAASERPP